MARSRQLQSLCQLLYRRHQLHNLSLHHPHQIGEEAAALVTVLFNMFVPSNNQLKALRALALLRAEPSTPLFALRSALAHARQQGSEDLPRLEEAQWLLSEGGNCELF
jgi:hypothetical protein